MNKVLQRIQHKFTFSYLDNLLIYSKTWDERMEHIQVVFDRLREGGLKLKMSKSEFLKQDINYLGHVISASGVKPDPEKICAIKELAAPKNVKKTRSLLGLCGWYQGWVGSRLRPHLRLPEARLFAKMLASRPSSASKH